MRLIGFGLLAFVLAAVAILLSNSVAIGLGKRALTEALTGPFLRFETAHPEGQFVQQGTELEVRRLSPNSPIILSGLPAYQGATFFMPVDARATSGYLQIDASFQVLAGVEAVLRVSISNQKRAEVLLRPGEAARSLRIDLTEEEITRERLSVSFSLQGEGGHNPCGRDEGIETVVEIETSSAVFLSLSEGVVSERDLALSSGKTMRMSWHPENDRGAALLRAAQLVSAGYAVSMDAESRFSPEADIVQALVGRPQARPRFAWSDVTQKGAPLYGVRHFKKEHHWRLRYDMARGQNKHLPRVLDLHMRLGSHPMGGVWHVSVTLNNRLVHQAVMEQGDLMLSERIMLPLSSQARLNVIEVSLNSTYRDGRECVEPPTLLAEVLPDTRLLPSKSQFSDAMSEFVAALAVVPSWSLYADGLNAGEAEVAAQLVAGLPVSLRENTPSAGGAQIHALHRGQSLRPWDREPSDDLWLLRSEEGRLVVAPLAEYPWYEAREVMLLVDLAPAAS